MNTALAFMFTIAAMLIACSSSNTSDAPERSATALGMHFAFMVE